MREIKFRAWNQLGEMIYPEDTNVFIGLDGQLYLWTAAGLYDLDKCILMQYTGLLDRNGKEIYEGDIAYHSGELNPRCARTGEISYRDGAFSYKANSFWDIALRFIDMRDMEIIGNIWENPELLGST